MTWRTAWRLLVLLLTTIGSWRMMVFLGIESVCRCTGWQNIDTLNEFTFLGSDMEDLLHVRLLFFNLMRGLGICSWFTYVGYKHRSKYNYANSQFSRNWAQIHRLDKWTEETRLKVERKIMAPPDKNLELSAWVSEDMDAIFEFEVELVIVISK